MHRDEGTYTRQKWGQTLLEVVFTCLFDCFYGHLHKTQHTSQRKSRQPARDQLVESGFTRVFV